MGLLQKFLIIIGGLGAGALVFSNPKGVAAAASAFKTATGGTVSQIVGSASGK